MTELGSYYSVQYPQSIRECLEARQSEIVDEMKSPKREEVDGDVTS